MTRLRIRVKKKLTNLQVLTGYFGPLPGGLLKQVGRRYTQLCAALAAVGAEAKELQVGTCLRFLRIQLRKICQMADRWVGLEGSFRRVHCVNTPTLI